MEDVESKHSEADIIAALKQVEAGRTAEDVARDCGNWSLNGGGPTPAITELASANTNDSVSQDGFTRGNYTGFTVDPRVCFNGNTQTIGQVAVATVANGGGENNFQATAASGQAVASVAGGGWPLLQIPTGKILTCATM